MQRREKNKTIEDARSHLTTLKAETLAEFTTNPPVLVSPRMVRLARFARLRVSIAIWVMLCYARMRTLMAEMGFVKHPARGQDRAAQFD